MVIAHSDGNVVDIVRRALVVQGGASCHGHDASGCIDGEGTTHVASSQRDGQDLFGGSGQGGREGGTRVNELVG